MYVAVRHIDAPQGDFVAADQTAQDWTQLQSHLVEDIEPLFANLDRFLEWLNRNKSAQSVSLIAELQQIVDEIRGETGAARR
jgi:hypothetical protein